MKKDKKNSVTKKTANRPRGRVIIVSNRLPFVIAKDEKGKWTIIPGSGGLVTALAPVLGNRGGLWVGWPGTVEDHEVVMDGLLQEATKDSGYQLQAVMLNAKEMENYYSGFSNEILWPLFHDFQSYCNFNPEYWLYYQQVNRKFAEVVDQNSSGRDFIWVHDYQLMSVAKELRALSNFSKLGFFLHIPFPPLDIFLKLPWRFEILRALLKYDLVGFQTLRDRRNFVECIRTLMKDVAVHGKGQVIFMEFEKREIRVGAFPISIDFNEFANLADTDEVAQRAAHIQNTLSNAKILLGIDRLDYSKGIIEKFKAFRNTLIRYPELQEKVVLVQVLVPSRRTIPRYDNLKEDIERLVGEINGEFTKSGWVPIHYIFRSLERAELLAYYRAAEVLLVTPIKDGMNIVAKEYCASKQDKNGVVILSEYAGTVAQFQKNALVVNPYDIEGVTEAIHLAVAMPKNEMHVRMRKLRQSVKKSDVYWWVNSFLLAGIAKRLDNFPIIEDFVPQDKSVKLQVKSVSV